MGPKGAVLLGLVVAWRIIIEINALTSMGRAPNRGIFSCNIPLRRAAMGREEI